MKRRLLVFAILMLGLGGMGSAEECPSHGGTSESGKNSHRDGVGVGVGVTIDLGGIGKRKKEEDPFDDPPKPHAPPREEYLFGILLRRNDDTWIPTPLNTTTLTATIYRKDPKSKKWAVSNVPKVITFHFAERSNEKGFCLNAGETTDPDLFFMDTLNEDLNCTDDPTAGRKGGYFGTAKTKREVISQVVTVSSADYGSFGKVQATAPGCTQLRETGREIEETSLENSMKDVPKDDNHNQIADYYEQLQGMKPAAEADDDKIPEGNKVDGDGLTAYEEYRGFMVEGVHHRTSWKVKDLFVYNPEHFDLSLFQTASNLAVWQVNIAEFGKGRVLNFNRGHAKKTVQHVLILRKGTLEGGTIGLAQHIPGAGNHMGPPKNVEQILIDAKHIDVLKEFFGMDLMRGTVAHELGHGCCIRHHGEGYYYEMEMTNPDLDHEARICEHVLPAKLYFGFRNGTICGDSECIMRYQSPEHCIYGYPDAAECIGRQDRGLQRYFCDTTRGTDFNAHGHFGGNCAAGRGECIHKIQVNDQ